MPVPPSTPAGRPPLALIGSDQEWSIRSIESILGPHGYAVLRAYNGKEVLERAQSGQPDVVILDLRLPDQDGRVVCRALREQRIVTPATPILMISSGHPAKADRLKALQAGAWEVLSLPLDAEEFLLRLASFVQAKTESDALREEGLVDRSTGFYSVRGLARRAREVGAEAFRRKTALACVVIGVDAVNADGQGADADAAALAQALEIVAQAFQGTARSSDIIGRLGRSEFAVIAPATDADGAMRLAERLAAAVESRQPAPGTRVSGVKVRAGYEAVADLHETPVEPVDLLVRATAALRQVRSHSDSGRFQRYEPQGPAAN
ncbi:MAG TPA: response regulator [Gemmatimonadales bacterium]|nr:response regulator [Gemmatimonadales bacterium]